MSAANHMKTLARVLGILIMASSMALGCNYDGIKDSDESCDGSDYGGPNPTCGSYNYAAGDVSCIDCLIDASGCGRYACDGYSCSFMAGSGPNLANNCAGPGDNGPCSGSSGGGSSGSGSGGGGGGSGSGSGGIPPCPANTVCGHVYKAETYVPGVTEEPLEDVVVEFRDINGTRTKTTHTNALGYYEIVP